MSIHPIIVGEPDDLDLDTNDMQDSLNFVSNGSADTIGEWATIESYLTFDFTALGMTETTDRQTEFKFSETLYACWGNL